MNVITIGSKIFDDAILQISAPICNIERITNISSFTFSHNYVYSISVNKEDEYKKRLISYELTGKDWIDDQEYDLVIVDLLDARLPFTEIITDNDMSIRISSTIDKNESKSKVNDFLKRNQINIVRKNEINPMELNDEQLEHEIEKFAKFISQNYDASKIVLLENYNVSQVINKTGEIELVPNYNRIESYNKFYRKCVEMFKKYVTVKSISMPSIIIGDIRTQQYHFFTMSRPYYKFLINRIINNKAEEKEILKIYENEIYDIINASEISCYVQNIANNIGGKKLVFIGESSAIRNILKQYDINVDSCIDYYSWSSENEILYNVQEQVKKGNCFLVINRMYSSVNILEMLRGLELEELKDYIYVSHKTTIYKDFSGEIRDIYNNLFFICTPCDVVVNGWGNVVTSYANSKVLINVQNYNQIKLEENVSCAVLLPLKIECENSCIVTIGKNTRIINDMEILAGSFSRIDIGKDCLFSTEITLKILMNKALGVNNIREIIIGNLVWVGYRAFIMSNSYIGDGCVVGARTTIWNKRIYNNCIVVGEEAKIIRKNIIWNVDSLLHEINECNQEYMKNTSEVD